MFLMQLVSHSLPKSLQNIYPTLYAPFVTAVSFVSYTQNKQGQLPIEELSYLVNNGVWMRYL
jgi:hypothetical protein